MRIKKSIMAAVLLATVLFPATADAQSSSINTFSPYTFYGIGDLKTQGPAFLRSMGGAGVAYRDTHLTPYSANLNTLNPASYSAIPRRSFLFNFELEGENYYLKDAVTKSSFNTFNVRDVSILMPLADKIGFSVSVTPYSSIGYNLKKTLNGDEELAIGDININWVGEGDITQLKAGIGAQLFPNFSLGAEMVYYKGYIDRSRSLTINSFTGEPGYTSAEGYSTDEVSRLFLNAGFQYNIINKPQRVLTVGGTYRMGGKLKPSLDEYIPANDPYGDTVYFSNKIGDFHMANEYAAGIFYHNARMSVGLDYSFADWGDRNKVGRDNMKYVNTHSVKGGLQYTPNRFDVRRFFKRLSYRVGARYEDYYMSFNDKKISDKVITFGVGMPLRMDSPSYLNLGFEFGQRGTTKFDNIKANYFKISIGLSLFGEDYWFWKQKYD